MNYILEKYNGLKTRFNCPNCEGTKCFTKYIDIDTLMNVEKELLRSEIFENKKVIMKSIDRPDLERLFTPITILLAIFSLILALSN